MLIRPAVAGDAAAIWSIIGPVMRAGETYAIESTMSEADAIGYWRGPDKETFVAQQDGGILGTWTRS
jgi:hypothetical protein